MENLKNQWFLVVAIFSLASCVTRADVEDFKKNQETIISKLDKLEKNLGTANNRPAPPQAPPGPDVNKAYAITVGNSPVHGAADAWVTVVEVSDFQCPFCARVVETIKEVEKTYGADVRVVFKNNPLPFHNRALPAAMASLCAQEQNKFWPMHDKLFENQRALEDNHLEEYAKELKLNEHAFKKCLSDPKIKSRIDEDQALAAKFGARGTPAFYINGHFLSGAQPFTAFKAVIDEQLKKAKESGVAKKAYYATVVEGKGEKSL